MATIKCYQCAYCEKSCSGCICTRYIITVSKDMVCVDSDELDNSVNNMIN